MPEKEKQKETLFNMYNQMNLCRVHCTVTNITILVWEQDEGDHNNYYFYLKFCPPCVLIGQDAWDNFGNQYDLLSNLLADKWLICRFQVQTLFITQVLISVRRFFVNTCSEASLWIHDQCVKKGSCVVQYSTVSLLNLDLIYKFGKGTKKRKTNLQI